ncbi:MAG: TolC family protein, partial [Terrimicrobiaceae bacterium]
MKSFPFLLIALWLCLMGLARSADNVNAASGSVTLGSLTSEALRNNPSINAALSRWMAMRERVPQAAAWDDPRVSSAFNAARFVEVPPNAFMDQTVTLEQMIPISGKNRVRGRIAGAEALAAFQAVRRAQLDVITKVRASYLRLLNSYALANLNEKNITSLRQIAEVARSRYETGKESATDALLAETEASKLQETRTDLERMNSDEQSQINILMNRDAFTPLDSPQKEILRRMDLP